MYMFKYVTKRIALMLLTFFIIFTMCFVLIKLLPIPTNVLPGQDPEIVAKTLEGRGWITNLREGKNGVWLYDRVPILEQYATYLKRIITQGDFGIATTSGEYINMPIWEVFKSHLPPTILINIYSTLIGVPIGLALGILAALKKNKWQDQLINIFIILLISVPSVVLALLIQYVLCFKLGWFPHHVNKRCLFYLAGVPLHAAGGVRPLPGLHSRLRPVYPRRAFRGAYRRIYAPGPYQGSYQEPGHPQTRHAQFHGSYLPVHP